MFTMMTLYLLLYVLCGVLGLGFRVRVRVSTASHPGLSLCKNEGPGAD